jgi:RimJ/RimL family protein N-acetyltransferase
LEPLAATHGDALYAAAMAPGLEARHRFLFDTPADRASFDVWLECAASSPDPMYFAVIDQHSGRCEGRLALMRMAPEHGVIEVGSILWGPALARTRAATEAIYLLASHVFDTLRYRRFEWKCNSANEPSKRAAERLGFVYEGTFRQHMVLKQHNRDTTWYSMLDSEWPAHKSRFEAWLDPSNFSEAGHQFRRLADFHHTPVQLHVTAE